MPRRTRTCGGKPVMSRPSSRIRPSVGRKTPVRRLLSVVLPAPLGPISAWRAPRSIASDTPLVAIVPSKRFSSPTVSSTAAIGSPRDEWRLACASGAHAAGSAQAGERLACHRCPHAEALVPDEHDDDQHQADPELPILRGDAGEPVLAELEQDRADQSAVQIT